LSTQTKVLAIAIISLVVAVIFAGIAAYNSYRLASIARTQQDINKKLDIVSSMISSNMTTLRTSVKSLKDLYFKVSALSKSVNDLYRSVKVLEANQTSQSATIAKALDSLQKIRNEVELLKIQLSSQSANITDINSKISRLEARIDNVYNLLMYPVTITDATGKPVTIPRRPTRIISLLPSVTEILWAVNASKQVIAVDEYSNYPPEVIEEVKNGTLINIGSGWYPNVELILSLNPDLVIGVDSVVSHHTLKRILAEYGIPMLLLPDRNFQDVLDSILLVGRATGHLVEASELVEKLKEEAFALRGHINSYLNETKAQRMKVALVAWISPLWIVGKGTFQDDIVILAGGVNAYSNVTGWSAVSPESLLSANPDVIIITAGHAEINMTRQDFIDYLKSKLGDSVYNISAVKSRRIYFIYGDYNDMLVRPGPRIIKATYLLSIILYPEAYGLNVSAIPEKISPDTFKLPSPPWS
jgi:iron complex transport system substrate-binding protein